ncbi:MAG: glycosyltransferase, partial [Chloroflexota bacterium]
NYGAFADLLWWLHRAVYNRADRVLATSERMVDDLTAHGVQNVGLWRRGVDVERFNPGYASNEMRARLTDGHPERTILLSVGRLAPEKQVGQLRDVLDQMRDDDVHLAIVGDGPERSALEDFFLGYPVTFSGYLRGLDLSIAFASADIFMFPSSVIETFGLVAAEAMASGTPVVASDVGGMREIIEHEKNGYIFAENDTNAMASFARQLVIDPERRDAFALRARACMENRTWDVVMEALIADYQSLILAKAPVAEMA